jgi:hypothetical protein
MLLGKTHDQETLQLTGLSLLLLAVQCGGLLRVGESGRQDCSQQAGPQQALPTRNREASNIRGPMM